MSKKLSELTKDWTPERKARVEDRVRQALSEMPLDQLRQAMELTQGRLAELMKINQSQVSKIERETDMLVSTLRSYIEALGGRLDVIAHLPSGDVRISDFEKVGKERVPA